MNNLKKIFTEQYTFEDFSISQYVDMLSFYERRVSNINTSSIDIDKRKQFAFNILLKEQDKDNEDKKKFMEFVNEMKAPKRREIINQDAPQNVKVGDDVFCYMDYKTQDRTYCNFVVKSQIIKINKTSFTIKQYDSVCSGTFQEQGWVTSYFTWKTNLKDTKFVKKFDKVDYNGTKMYDVYIHPKTNFGVRGEWSNYND